MCALYMRRVLINIHTVSPPVEIQTLNKDSTFNLFTPVKVHNMNHNEAPVTSDVCSGCPAAETWILLT